MANKYQEKCKERRWQRITYLEQQMEVYQKDLDRLKEQLMEIKKNE